MRNIMEEGKTEAGHLWNANLYIRKFPSFKLMFLVSDVASLIVLRSQHRPKLSERLTTDGQREKNKQKKCDGNNNSVSILNLAPGVKWPPLIGSLKNWRLRYPSGDWRPLWLAVSCCLLPDGWWGWQAVKGARSWQVTQLLLDPFPSPSPPPPHMMTSRRPFFIGRSIPAENPRHCKNPENDVTPPSNDQ